MMEPTATSHVQLLLLLIVKYKRRTTDCPMRAESIKPIN